MIDSHYAFVGDVLALDFVNTAMVVRGKPVDVIATAEGYADWWEAATHHYPEVSEYVGGAGINSAMLPEAHALRDALRDVFEAVAGSRPASANALAVLNRTLDCARDQVEIDPDGRYRPRRRAAGPADGPLLAVARSALDLLTGVGHERIHACANPRCVLIFFDTTKSGTRRWCSTACMNRARSAANYRARKGSPEADQVPGI